MAMNASTMATAVVAAIKAATAAWQNPADDHTLAGLDYDTYLNAVWLAACTEIVDHITANGQATGLDSRGDTHTLDLS